jgi:hypothetical protein
VFRFTPNAGSNPALSAKCQKFKAVKSAIRAFQQSPRKFCSLPISL